MEKIKGVNLGGWLVLEKWITPSLFKGTHASDETAFCEELGERTAGIIDTHRKSFVAEDDILWLKERGITALRVPVPHWIFGGAELYVGAGKYLDWIMDTALRHKLSVLIDLHAAPGSQNGKDHSAKAGTVEWHTGAGNITRTLEVVERLAERYCKYPNLLGIELLNEPSAKIPRDILTEYFRLGYERVRKYCNSDIAVVISDAFNPLEWQEVLTDEYYQNVWLDTHLYQCFSDDDKHRGIHGNLKKAKKEWAALLAGIQKQRPVIVGEWSLALDAQAFRGLDSYERDKAIQAYGRAQLSSFSQGQGWFYWTLKTEDGGAWSLQDAVTRGWLNLNDSL